MQPGKSTVLQEATDNHNSKALTNLLLAYQLKQHVATRAFTVNIYIFTVKINMDNQDKNSIKKPWTKPELMLISSGQIEKGNIPNAREATLVVRDGFYYTKMGQAYGISFPLNTFAS
jgi:hypothetical protein